MGGNHSNPVGRYGPERGSLRSEDLLLRNHDFQWGYDVAVEVRNDDGVAFEKRYYLQPGGARSELDVLSAGEYAVRVVLDDRREATAECVVGEGPDRGVLVEVGNGAVSLQDRLYA